MLGAGAWGTAVAILLAGRSGHGHGAGGLGGTGEVVLWARSAELAGAMSRSRCNDTYLEGVHFPGALKVTSSLQEAMDGAGTCVVAVPSRWLREVVAAAAPWALPGCAAVSLAKGIEAGSLLRMSEVLAQVLPGHPVAVVGGPNLAGEVAAGLPAATVIASHDAELASRLRAAFSFPHLRAYTNDDVVGSELAGAGKNVVALAAGMADGLGAGDNARAAIVTRGVAELARLGVAAGGQALTFAGLAGLGDIVLTCTSRRSRNWKVGFAVGQGRPLATVLTGLHQVAEGVASAGPIVELGARMGVELPICEQVAGVLAGVCTPTEALYALLERETPHELAGLAPGAERPVGGP